MTASLTSRCPALPSLPSVWSAPLGATIDEIVEAVRASLTDDLLDATWRKKRASGALKHVVATTGHCFVAAQAVYWLLGGPDGAYKGAVMRVGPGPRDTHWFVRGSDGKIIDPTFDQFAAAPDYSRGRNCGFSTRHMGTGKIDPCKRTQVVIARAIAIMDAGAQQPIAA